MTDVDNGQEIDPLQDENVGEFDADADADVGLSLDDPVENEGDAEAGQDEGAEMVEDPVSILLCLCRCM